jgi:TonB-dependent SusC/RagA subfamily outer membrane receptor
MSSPARSARTAVALGVLVGIFSGCAHTRETDEPADAPDRTPPDPSTVTAEDIERQPGESLEQILAGRISGVEVFQTRDGIRVRIRGATSIYGSNEPLYVIDGVPVTPGPGGNLTGINPFDIESIEVLKDPIDTSMYGLRGANGVIVIKTKAPPR